MANLNGFNANNVKPSQSFDPIPAGKYLATITTSEMLPTNNRNGQFLKLEFVVADGEYKGRKLWSRLNLNNPSAQAVEIAQRQLSAICHAVGVLEPRDSVDLHNLPLVVKVKIGKNNNTGEPTNEITGYEAKGSTATPQGSQQAPPPPPHHQPAMAGAGVPSAPSAPATAPWQRQ